MCSFVFHFFYLRNIFGVHMCCNIFCSFLLVNGVIALCIFEAVMKGFCIFLFF